MQCITLVINLGMANTKSISVVCRTQIEFRENKNIACKNTPSNSVVK